MVFAACEVNRDVWYGATNLMSCKIKTRLCRWIWEDGNFHALSHALLRDHYGLDYIWKDLGMLWSMHTLFVTFLLFYSNTGFGFCSQILILAMKAALWQNKQEFKCYFKLREGKKEWGEERREEKKSSAGISFCLYTSVPVYFTIAWLSSKYHLAFLRKKIMTVLRFCCECWFIFFFNVEREREKNLKAIKV